MPTYDLFISEIIGLIIIFDKWLRIEDVRFGIRSTERSFSCLNLSDPADNSEYDVSEFLKIGAMALGVNKDTLSCQSMNL